jgi:hypothetical protein
MVVLCGASATGTAAGRGALVLIAGSGVDHHHFYFNIFFKKY